MAIAINRAKREGHAVLLQPSASEGAQNPELAAQSEPATGPPRQILLFDEATLAPTPTPKEDCGHRLRYQGRSTRRDKATFYVCASCSLLVKEVKTHGAPPVRYWGETSSPTAPPCRGSG